MPSHSPPAQLIGAAVALQRAGRIAEAITAYQQLLARWPRLADCWYNLGVLLRQARRFEAALDAYQKALDLGVRQPEEVHLNRGVIYADHLARPDAAEHELQLALARNPGYLPALFNYANLCEDLGRREQAQAALERLLAIEPAQFEALARYAQLQPLAADNAAIIQRSTTRARVRRTARRWASRSAGCSMARRAILLRSRLTRQPIATVGPARHRASPMIARRPSASSTM